MINERLTNMLQYYLPHYSKEYIPDIVYDFIIENLKQLKKIMEEL